ncbi:hypothetical protein [Adhaeretor mobilis]|nr:hypothetical protein [Adhaeretor mobilis]
MSSSLPRSLTRKTVGKMLNVETYQARHDRVHGLEECGDLTSQDCTTTLRVVFGPSDTYCRDILELAKKR